MDKKVLIPIVLVCLVIIAFLVLNYNENDNKNLENSDIIDEFIIFNEEKRKLYDAIEKLDKNTRLVILCRIYGNFSFKEIGELFNKSENWARTIFFRGKAKLKEGLV